MLTQPACFRIPIPLRLSFLLAVFPGLLAAASPSLRLYAPPAPEAVGTPSIHPAWELFLASSPGPSGDTLVLRVLLRRKDHQGAKGLLLTLAANSLKNRKSVARRQARFTLAAGQREEQLSFSLENPGCGPAKVVAALFKDGQPLARTQQILRFPCAD